MHENMCPIIGAEVQLDNKFYVCTNLPNLNTEHLNLPLECELLSLTTEACFLTILIIPTSDTFKFGSASQVHSCRCTLFGSLHNMSHTHTKKNEVHGTVYILSIFQIGRSVSRKELKATQLLSQLLYYQLSIHFS